MQAEFRVCPRHAQCVSFSPNGQEMVTAGMDALAQVWSVPSFEHVRTFEGHDKSVNAVGLSPEGELAVTGSSDRSVIVWDYRTCKQLSRMTGFRNTVASAAFSPAGDVAAFSSYDGRVGLWRRGSDSLEIFRAHARHVTSVSFSPDSSMLATAGIGNVVKVWDVASGEARAETEAPGDAAISCRFLDSGNLFCMSYEGHLSILSGLSENRLELTHSREIGGPPPASMTAIPGTSLLWCSVQGGVRALDLDALEVVTEARTKIKGMYGVGCSPDGSLLAAVGADGRCRVWSLEV